MLRRSFLASLAAVCAAPFALFRSSIAAPRVAREGFVLVNVEASYVAAGGELWRTKFSCEFTADAFAARHDEPFAALLRSKIPGLPASAVLSWVTAEGPGCMLFTFCQLSIEYHGSPTVMIRSGVLR